MNDIKNNSKWESLVGTWNYVGPPASPSEDDINIYRQFIMSSIVEDKPISALLLGCTPSLRLLLADMNISVTCVDVNPNMIASTTLFLGDLVKDEACICQDWLKMKLKNKYSIIIGDKVLDNIPYEKWGIFKENLLAHLVTNGSLITRIAPQDPLLIGNNFTNLLMEWTKRYKLGQVSLRNAASGLWEQALGASAKTVPGKQSIVLFMNEIQELKKNINKLSMDSQNILCEFENLFSQSIEHEWTSYSFDNIIDSFSDEFVLTSKKHANDYKVAKRQPILLFRKIK